MFWLILSEAVAAGKKPRPGMLPMATVAPVHNDTAASEQPMRVFCWLRVTSQRRRKSWCHLFLERYLSVFTGVCESEYELTFYRCGDVKSHFLLCKRLTHYSVQVCSATVKCVSSPSQSKSDRSTATLVMLFSVVTVINTEGSTYTHIQKFYINMGQWHDR